MNVDDAIKNCKENWILNPNEKVVNGIINMCNKNEGLCPCSGNDSVDKHCPCSNYRENDVCTCKLYVKK